MIRSCLRCSKQYNASNQISRRPILRWCPKCRNRMIKDKENWHIDLALGSNHDLPSLWHLGQSVDRWAEEGQQILLASLRSTAASMAGFAERA